MSTIKSCLITGANSGIGKQAAIQLAGRGYRVYVGARNLERGNTAVADIRQISASDLVHLLPIDMSSKHSILVAAERLSLELSSLDVLIHNAADFDISRKQPLITADGVESVWATNHIGPIRLTDALLPFLAAAEQGRIITIASKGLIVHPGLKVSLSDPEFRHRRFSVSKAYYQSKLAQLMYTYWLADQLQSTNVTANCIRVTNVKLDMSRYPDVSDFMKILYRLKSRFSISPEQMAQTYTYLATDLDLSETSGKYFDEKNRQVSSSSYSRNQDNINAVMQMSLKYLD